MPETLVPGTRVPGTPAPGTPVPGTGLDPRQVAWRDTMRPVRFYVFDARLLLLAAPWLFLPDWWTTAAVLGAALACRAAEARGYRLRAAIRALRARAAGRRRALHAGRERRFTDFG